MTPEDIARRAESVAERLSAERVSQIAATLADVQRFPSRLTLREADWLAHIAGQLLAELRAVEKERDEARSEVARLRAALESFRAKWSEDHVCPFDGCIACGHNPEHVAGCPTPALLAALAAVAGQEAAG
jgi:hypothetical protein